MSDLITINIKWDDVKTPADYTEIITEITKVKAEVLKKQKESQKDVVKLYQKRRIQALRKAKTGDAIHTSRIWISGDIQYLNGKTGKKVKDGTKYMVVDFGINGTWKLSYQYLKLGKNPNNEKNVSLIANTAKKLK